MQCDAQSYLPGRGPRPRYESRPKVALALPSISQAVCVLGPGCKRMAVLFLQGAMAMCWECHCSREPRAPRSRQPGGARVTGALSELPNEDSAPPCLDSPSSCGRSLVCRALKCARENNVRGVQ